MLTLRQVIDSKNYLIVRDQVRMVTDYIFLYRQDMDCSDDKNLGVVKHYFDMFCEAYDDIQTMDDLFESEEWKVLFETGCERFAEMFILASNNDLERLPVVTDLAYSLKAVTKFKFFIENYNDPLLAYDGTPDYPNFRYTSSMMEKMKQNLEDFELGVNQDGNPTGRLVEKDEFIEEYEDEITISDDDFIDDRDEISLYEIIEDKDDIIEEANNSVPRKRLRRLID